ncbi:sensor histidine kinase [Permianibacter sp. IMCC34836]|uniref:sensor histidine kinase n=1 Tax=Permianibacter fluminis TaxID=2738515 RepID=UPI001554344C|nr:histidine kinase [Permianibacter fluminis]NQD36922.1 sensor histidine kinase [Permianibacter fluminis]
MTLTTPACPAAATTERAFDWLFWVGILTWAIVTTVELLLSDARFAVMPATQAWLTVLGYLLFLAGFLLAVFKPARLPQPLTQWLGVGLEGLSVLALQCLEPRSLNQILLIMWSSQLPYYLPLSRAMLLSALALGLNAVIRLQLEPHSFFWFEPGIYFTFSLFAMVSSRNAMVAERAREELAQRNAELLATQNLLAASATESERLRIARDLHDSMGHHLTALALQLEILQHQQGDTAKQTQEQARQLVKLLLADVRATVSNLRAEHSLHLNSLLAPLLQSTPRLHIISAIPDELTVSDARTAETLLRATQEIITNTWRHANAQSLELQVSAHAGQLILEASDDGRISENWQPGNGLTGLRERISELGGHCDLQRDQRGNLRVRLELPQVPA